MEYILWIVLNFGLDFCLKESQLYRSPIFHTIQLQPTLSIQHQPHFQLWPIFWEWTRKWLLLNSYRMCLICHHRLPIPIILQFHSNTFSFNNSFVYTNGVMFWFSTYHRSTRDQLYPNTTLSLFQPTLKTPVCPLKISSKSNAFGKLSGALATHPISSKNTRSNHQTTNDCQTNGISHLALLWCTWIRIEEFT